MTRAWNAPVFAVATVYFVVDGIFSYVTRPLTAYDDLRVVATTAQRRLLAELRRHGRIDDDAYHLLEGELDRAELYAASVDQFGAQES